MARSGIRELVIAVPRFLTTVEIFIEAPDAEIAEVLAECYLELHPAMTVYQVQAVLDDMPEPTTVES